MGYIASPSDIKNPEIQQIISRMDPRGSVAPLALEDARRFYREAASLAGPPEPVASAKDQTVPGQAGKIPIRIYSPKITESRSLPVVFFIHGGGFVTGDLETHDPICRFLANHTPAVVIAAEYRLAPEHRYPAAPNDCYAVLHWLSTNASSIGGDAARITVVGDSAGGNLAAVMTLMARDRGGPSISAQILLYPFLDGTLSCDSVVENALMLPFTLIDHIYCGKQYLTAKQDRREPYVSPLQAQNLSGLSPALIITAEHDILSDEGEAYANRLQEAGVPVEHDEFPGMVHGFFQWGGAVAGGRLAMNRVVQYLQRY